MNSFDETNPQKNQHQLNLKPFDKSLVITKDDIPDPQNFHMNTHAKIPLPKVGITNLQLPINIKRRSGDEMMLKGTISAYVSMENTEVRGINMSRLARCFYDHVDGKGAIELLDLLKVVDDYREKLPADNGYLKLRFDYPYKQKHDREGHYGWLYYPVEFEIQNVNGTVKTFLQVVYTYNSACPCSASLAEYSRTELDVPAISHSQRSEATVKVQFDPTSDNLLWIEDIVDICRFVQPSEVLAGIVTRVGEFSMAQRVASTEEYDEEGNVVQYGSIGFIEDLLRKFWQGFQNEQRVIDFSIGLEHFEALNSNFAAGFINKSLTHGVGLS